MNINPKNTRGDKNNKATGKTRQIIKNIIIKTSAHVGKGVAVDDTVDVGAVGAVGAGVSSKNSFGRIVRIKRERSPRPIKSFISNL